MSFDGIPKPSQMHAYADPLSPYLGAHQANEAARSRPKIGKNKAAYSTEKINKELEQYQGIDDEEPKEGLNEEEREQILIFAKLRGLMNFSLESGVLYRFQVNEETGLVDLIDSRDEKVLLTLTAEELLKVSEKINRYAGMITDREA